MNTRDIKKQLATWTFDPKKDYAYQLFSEIGDQSFFLKRAIELLKAADVSLDPIAQSRLVGNAVKVLTIREVLRGQPPRRTNTGSDYTQTQVAELVSKVNTR